MTNVASSSFKTKAASLFADLLLLAGLGLVSWGAFKFSHALGIIVAGIVLVIIARAITPDKKN